MDLETLERTYYVVAAAGAKTLEAYQDGDLRVLDEELETGVKALFSNEHESIVAFLFAKGHFTDEAAQAWVKAAEKEGINLSIRFMTRMGQGQVVSTQAEASFKDIFGLLGEAIDGDGLTMPDGSYRWPWLIDAYPEYCIVEIGARTYKLTYTLNDDLTVEFGALQEVQRTWDPVPAAAATDGSIEARRFILQLRDVPEGFETDVPEGDDLIWKEIFRVSTTFRADGSVLEVDQPMVDHLAESYGASVLDKIPITASTHYEETNGIVPAEDTNGEVAAIVQEGGSLFGGLRIVDPDIREKIDQNLIASCSIYAWPNYVDRRDGKVWPWVLGHLLLTNYPQLPDLKPFGEKPESLAASMFAEADTVTYVEDTDMPENTTGTNVQTAPVLSVEDQALLAEAKRLRAEGVSLSALQTQQEELRTQARTLEVGSIVSALEGRQDRDDVTSIEGYRHYPAVIAAAERMLAGEGIGFSLDITQSGKANTDQLVLGILNAIPAEGRLALAAPVTPNRAPESQTPQPVSTEHRTTPLTPEQRANVSDEAVDDFVDRIS
jgi:hypothetical protein